MGPVKRESELKNRTRRRSQATVPACASSPNIPSGLTLFRLLLMSAPLIRFAASIAIHTALRSGLDDARNAVASRC